MVQERKLKLAKDLQNTEFKASWLALELSQVQLYSFLRKKL